MADEKMNPIIAALITQLVGQIINTVISEMQKAGMTPEQQTVLYTQIMARVRADNPETIIDPLEGGA
jgi:hypothetical protein